MKGFILGEGRRHTLFLLHKTHIYFPFKNGTITEKSNLAHKISFSIDINYTLYTPLSQTKLLLFIYFTLNINKKIKNKNKNKNSCLLYLKAELKIQHKAMNMNGEK